MAEHTTTLPSGVEIVFEDGEPDEAGRSKRRSYLVNGEKLPSVTTVLGCLDKPGFPYAAEKLAVAAAIELAKEGELPVTVDGALSRMKARNLRFWQVWASKADRGTLGHEDLVKLCMGEPPSDLDSFAPEERGIIQGVSAFYADEQPQIEQAEQMVASVKHGFAGRHDFYGVLPRRHPTAKCLSDLKSTEKLPRYKNGAVKPPYPEMLLQLGLYEVARREGGLEPSDYQAVIRVDASGEYDVFCTVVDLDLPLAVLGAYKALKGLPTKPVDPAAATDSQLALTEGAAA